MSNQWTIGERPNNKNIESLNLTAKSKSFKALTWKCPTSLGLPNENVFSFISEYSFFRSLFSFAFSKNKFVNHSIHINITSTKVVHEDVNNTY